VRFENLRQGSYELEVFFPNLKPVIEKIEISDKTQEPVVIKLQTVTVGRLGLPCMGTEGEPPSVSISYVERSSRVDLTGLIRNELRMPVSNVSLNLVGHDMSRDAVSNNSGEFAFSGLAPGKYVLSSTRGAYRDIDGSVWITHNNLAKVIIDERQLSCIDHVLNSERTQDKTGPLLQLPRPE
jgi:hypothetical protein